MQRDLVECELTDEGPVRRGAVATGGPREGKRSVTVNMGESPLAWLYSRGHLSDVQFAAGECLGRDWERAQLAPAITMRWDQIRVQGGGGGEVSLSASERQLAARARFDGAVTAAGPGLSDILWRVVCAGETVPLAERGLGWPVRSGKLVLRLALDRVAGFYRIG